MANNPTQVLFRSDSSSCIGTGHIMRDLVLAKQYASSGHHIVFATQDLYGNINHKITEYGFDIHILNSNLQDELDALIQYLNTDLLVIDNYDIDFEFEEYLKIKNPELTILSFDDTYQKHSCDILLNHNIGADEKRYLGLVPKLCEIRCGTEYTLLREEFYTQKLQPKMINVKTQIFVAMGGSDHSNINISLLEVLKKFNNIHVNIVTTLANRNIEKLKKYCANEDSITLLINSNNIAKLMYDSDLAIVTPSVTVNEIIFMEIPFIAIKTADNQKYVYEYLIDNNYIALECFCISKLNSLVKVFMESIV